MSLVLGPASTALTINLVRAGSWWATLHSVTSATDPTPLDYPAGAVLEIRFGDGTVWAATIAGPDATWDVSPADVAALIAARPHTAELWLTTGGHSIPWAIGRVSVSG